jgi:uncharacterized protein (DUF58 family)
LSDRRIDDVGIEDAIRSELSALRLRALQERAASEGVDEDAIEDALEADRPKVALAELIVQRVSNRAQALTMALRKLRPTQLKKRAREAGVPADALEATDDAKRPKEALIALLVEAEGGNNSNTQKETAS